MFLGVQIKKIVKCKELFICPNGHWSGKLYEIYVALCVNSRRIDAVFYISNHSIMWILCVSLAWLVAANFLA
jgi:hypothetical protein